MGRERERWVERERRVSVPWLPVAAISRQRQPRGVATFLSTSRSSRRGQWWWWWWWRGVTAQRSGHRLESREAKGNLRRGATPSREWRSGGCTGRPCVSGSCRAVVRHPLPDVSLHGSFFRHSSLSSIVSVNRGWGRPARADVLVCVCGGDRDNPEGAAGPTPLNVGQLATVHGTTRERAGPPHRCTARLPNTSTAAGQGLPSDPRYRGLHFNRAPASREISI